MLAVDTRPLHHHTDGVGHNRLSKSLNVDILCNRIKFGKRETVMKTDSAKKVEGVGGGGSHHGLDQKPGH